MRLRLLITGAAVAACAALGLSAPALAAPAGVHPDGTTACGAACLNVSSETFGPADVLNFANSGKITLRQASDVYTNEDLAIVGGSILTVNAYEQAGLISKTSYAYLHYRWHFAAQIVKAPDGVISDTCIGVASTATNGENVTGQPCDTGGSRTLWIFDPANAQVPGSDCLDASTYCPVINGSDANPTVPEVLTAVGVGKALQVDRMTGDTASSPNAEDLQQFEYTTGPNP